jgi:hypothetical protein
MEEYEKSYKSKDGRHEVHVSLPESNQDNEINLAIWSCGNRSSSGIFFRVKMIFQILLRGHCYEDLVNLEPLEAKRLSNTLSELAEVADFRRQTVEDRIRDHEENIRNLKDE